MLLLGHRKYFRVPQMDSESREYIKLFKKRKKEVERESVTFHPTNYNIDLN